MNTFQVHILAADQPFYEGKCESLIIPTIEGQYGIMAHHFDMIGALVPGVLKFRAPGREDQFASVSAGLVKIEKNDVLVLVDSAERPEDIDVNRAKRAADEAREALLQKKSIQEYKLAQADLARAVSRLKVQNYHVNQ